MKFKTKPYEHQMDAFEMCKDLDYFALFMDMGTGKTKTAIDIANYKFLDRQINAVLIIAPNNVHTQWINEQLPEHSGLSYMKFVWQSNKVKTIYYKNAIENFIYNKSDKIKFMSEELS